MIRNFQDKSIKNNADTLNSSTSLTWFFLLQFLNDINVYDPLPPSHLKDFAACLPAPGLTPVTFQPQ